MDTRQGTQTGAYKDTAAGRPDPVLKISFVEFVSLTAVLMALTALSIDIMLPALPQIGHALGVASENDRQQIIIVYMAGFAAGQLIYGPLSDRLGRKPVLMGGLAVFVAGSGAALLSQSFATLLMARLIQGLGAASPRVVAIAVVRDIYSGRHMARVMSLAMMVFILIPVLAPSVGQGLLHLGDWRLTFDVLLVLGLAVAVWAGLRLPETAHLVTRHTARPTLLASLKQAVLDRQTMTYGITTGLMFSCLLSYVASSQQIFTEVFHEGANFPLLFGAVASTMAIASFINANLVGRLGMRRVSHTALVIFIAASLTLAFASTAGHASLGVFAILLASAFFCFGLITPNFNALAMECQGENAGMASSVTGALSTAIGAGGGGAIGAAFDGTVLPLALGFAACSVMAFIVVFAFEGPTGIFGRGGT
ncbi:MAG TPA: multidrug effflux MFS transporter [Hyphomicrobium sp.]|nr:multidrug effflux MFS transporter [Hyphomicrobium sp.]